MYGFKLCYLKLVINLILYHYQDFDDMEIPFGPKKKMLTVIDRYKKTGAIVIDQFENRTPSSRQVLVKFFRRNLRNNSENIDK